MTIAMIVERAEAMRTTRVPRSHRARHARVWALWRKAGTPARKARSAFREAVAEHPEAACLVVAVSVWLGLTIGASL